MNRTLLGLSTAIALLAGSAHAQSERVQIAGLDGRAIRVQLLQAAERVCLRSLADSGPQAVSPALDDHCTSDTFEAALRQAKRANPQAFRSSLRPTTLASR